MDGSKPAHSSLTIAAAAAILLVQLAQLAGLDAGLASSLEGPLTDLVSAALALIAIAGRARASARIKGL